MALVIRELPDGPRVLLVQRPPDDDDLPLAWGLPAATLGADESWEDAVRRAVREKLGIEVEPGQLLNEGRRQRSTYELHMRLYPGRITEGEPRLDRTPEGVTRYVDWKWGDPGELAPAFERGSLCARLFLEVMDPGGGRKQKVQ